MASPFSSSVFPATPSAALLGEALQDVPGWGLHREDAWPTPDNLAQRPPLFSYTDDEEPQWSYARRAKRSGVAKEMMAAYDALDAFWRLSCWVNEQGPGASISWEVDYPPPNESSDPSDPCPPGPPILSIVQVGADGSRKSYWLSGMEEALGSVLQRRYELSCPAGNFDVSTPVEDRLRDFAGPAVARWWKELTLDQSLPAPSRRPAGPRF